MFNTNKDIEDITMEVYWRDILKVVKGTCRLNQSTDNLIVLNWLVRSHLHGGRSPYFNFSA